MNSEIRSLSPKSVIPHIVEAVAFCRENARRVAAGSGPMAEFLFATAELSSAVVAVVSSCPGPGSPVGVEDGPLSPDDPHAVLAAYLETVSFNLRVLLGRDLTSEAASALFDIRTAVDSMRLALEDACTGSVS